MKSRWWSISEILQCVTVLGTAIAVGVLGWGLFWALDSFRPAAPQLMFPKRHEILVPFSFSGHYHEVGPTSKAFAAEFCCEGTLLAHPISLHQGGHYLVKLEELTWKDQEDRLLFSFHRDANGDHIYRTGEHLSSEQRQQVLSSLEVDWTSQVLEEDRSLLLEEARLTFSPRGSIANLDLGDRLLPSLDRHWERQAGGSLLIGLANSLEQLPPLLPQTYGGPQWTTEGTVLVPLTVTHSARESASGGLTGNSHGRLDAPLPWRAFRQWALTQDTLQLHWEVDEAHRLRSLSGSLSVEIEAELLQVKDIVALAVDWDLKPSWVPMEEPVIPDWTP